MLELNFRPEIPRSLTTRRFNKTAIGINRYGGGCSISWSAWNMPSSITSGGASQSWLYGPEHERYKMDADGRTTWYLNPSVHQGSHYERTQYSSGTIEHRVTLYGGGAPIGEIINLRGRTRIKFPPLKNTPFFNNPPLQQNCHRHQPLRCGGGRSISWTAWNMPSSITSGGASQSWLYGPEDQSKGPCSN